MDFCPECNKMLYYPEEDGKLLEKCRACDFSRERKKRTVQSNVYRSTGLVDTGAKNFLIYDPTLARTNKKECPNEACPSRQDKKLQEAVFFQDKVSMKVVYICTACNTEWRYS